jgi:murein DD-endopeptidase MepM/ murein hydrolase activator NlpD
MTRPTRSASRPLWGAVLAALLGGAALGPRTPGQGLSGKLRSTEARQDAVRDQLRSVKAEQAKRRRWLSDAQIAASRARSAYCVARSRLDSTREELRGARRRYEACIERLRSHDAAVCARVKVMYEIGEPSYMEVLLDATTFSDFVERADYLQRIAQHDADLLVRYTNERKQAEALRTQLETVQAEEERQARTLSRKKADAEAKAAKARDMLRKASRERAAYEQELAELERVEKQISELIARVQRGSSSLRYTGNWSGWGSAPIRAPHRLTSGFGMRFHPILREWKAHKGVDLACPTGTRIHAAASGRVVSAGWRSVLGNAVIIDHGGGWSTVYGHCSRLAVSTGQDVKAGQVIGSVGSTGRSTGPHLHFGVRKYGTCIDPLTAGAY